MVQQIVIQVTMKEHMTDEISKCMLYMANRTRSRLEQLLGSHHQFLHTQLHVTQGDTGSKDSKCASSGTVAVLCCTGTVAVLVLCSSLPVPSSYQEL